MDPATKITLAIPTYNRYDMVLECFAEVLNDDRIGEIIICDDFSTDGSYEKLIIHFHGSKKVRVFQNKKNLDCHYNKAAAVNHATNAWVILFDDDNIIGRQYLDALYALPVWSRDTIYCPEFARPHFDYRAFSGVTITARNVSALMERQHFSTLLNTANYLVPRDGYLDRWDGSINPHTADSIFMAYRWISHLGDMHVVPGLQYFHRVHEGSHYKNNVHKTGNFARQIEDKIRKLK